MTIELTDEERDLLLAIVDRGDGNGSRIRIAERLAFLGLIVLGYRWRPTDAGRLVADLLRQQDETREQVSRITSESNKLRTENGRLRVETADLLRRIEAAPNDEDMADQFHKGWQTRGDDMVLAQRLAGAGWAKPHPAVYVPDDPTVIVGVLGKDCPDGWEWSATLSTDWRGCTQARIDYQHDLGMIRPVPRPDVVVSIPADLADEIASKDWGDRLGAAVLGLIRAARDEA
jgi:hypothetical protein